MCSNESSVSTKTGSGPKTTNHGDYSIDDHRNYLSTILGQGTLEGNLLDRPDQSIERREVWLARRLRSAGVLIEDSCSESLVHLERSAGRLFREIQAISFDPSKHYASDVLPCGDTQSHDRLSKQLIRGARSFQGDLCIIATHDDHLHVVHDCRR